ncbi:MAG: peptide chain release factor N(5)-glutamine methyltransferase [Parachlamydiales bacterium]|nr:peptide chain release factor N(5)-glutamine methyltransferase [Parachlamydiales bacterium]
MNTLLDVLKRAEKLLEKKAIENSKVSAEVLLSHLLEIKKNDLYLNYEKKISNEVIQEYNDLVAQRAKNEPIEYITQKTTFYDLELVISKDVLIPRQETEILVDFIIKDISKDNFENKVLFDICTGSGCIGLAIKNRLKNLKIYMSDISDKAINIAQKNALKNSLEVNFLQGDLLDPYINLKADYVVCNPPYISEEEFKLLDKDVKDFEPKEALVAKMSGLEFYIRLEKELKKYLNPKAKLFFEIGYNQKEDILKNIFTSDIWKNKRVIKDYSQNNRFFFVLATNRNDTF